jgi:uncharacterized protein YbjT (DUF2867 family)
MSGRIALLAGGTGLVGSACLQALLQDTGYEKVYLLTRRSVPALSHPKLTQCVVDFDSLDTLQLPAATDVFCALGTTIRKAGSRQAFRRVDFEIPLAIARLSLQSGAQNFVLCSSVGADPASRNFYLRTKGELEQALRALPFRGLRIFRPSILMGHREESRPGEFLGVWAGRLFQFLMLGPLRRYRPVAAERVGRAMVASTGTGTSCLEYDAICGLARGVR